MSAQKPYTKTCPVCQRFIEVCDCAKSVPDRLPRDYEVRKYVNAEVLGFSLDKAFISGFIAGWAARQDHLQDFIDSINKTKEKVTE